jgi:dipeptidyl-peptidase-4
MRLGHLTRTWGVLLCLLLNICPLVSAQEKRELTVDWIYSDEGEEPARLPSYVWLQDGSLLLYDTRKPKAERTFERLNPETGQRSAAVDKDKALASLRSLEVKESELDSLAWPESFDAAGRRALYVFGDDLYLLELETAQASRVTATEEEEQAARFSPDGNRIAFVRANNLFVYDIARQTEKQVTRDGSETVLNGTLSWVYWEELFGREDIGYWWSGDSQAIAFYRTDESPVNTISFVDFTPEAPRVIRQRYPKAGSSNPLVRLGIVEVEAENPQPVWLDSSEIAYEYLARVKWLPGSRRLAVQTLNREQTRLDLYFLDRGTGEAQRVLTETDPASINIHDDLVFLGDGRHFLWSSERDGYAHLYRYTTEGVLVNQITKGNWSVRWSGGSWVGGAVQAVDEKAGWVYFTALEKSSVERHLYRTRLDGSGLERVSREDGAHRIALREDGRFYLDEYSNSNTPPSLSLHRADGSRVSVLAAPRTDLLAGFDLQYSAYFTVPAGDGFPMPAQILKPKDFDPTRKYPVILYVYGGPSSPTVSDAWPPDIFFDNILLRNGFLVMRVDNRSATAISKTLEATIQKQMYGTHELEDLLAGVRWLKSQPYVDPERVGIWGWSGGGTFTLLAMTRSTEFKAGIAGAPVTDWHYYDTAWTEKTMKRPQENPQGYDETSLTKRAKDLHGRLLIIHGTYDDNVHPQNTWHFVDELIKAGKMFDMMIYPMRKHSFTDRPARIHRAKTMIEFWKAHL